MNDTNSKARTTLSTVRALRSALDLVGSELVTSIHSVRRVGDEAHALLTVEVRTARGRRAWTTNRMAVVLGFAANGRTPMMRGRSDAARLRVRALGMALGRRRVETLNYWADSSAHFWCADNAPDLYTTKKG